MKLEELEKLYYDGNDLGAIYNYSETDFAIWSPLADAITLCVKIGGNFRRLPMVKDNHHVFRYKVRENILNAPYCFYVKNPGRPETKVLDPYGKGMTLNSEYNAVVDVKKIQNYYNRQPKSDIKDAEDAIIYEVGVRDFTEDKHSNIRNKGTYLGFVEAKRKTRGGHPAGLDYLRYLGVSHVQLNPVIDFANVDDVTKKTYNWGYDPISFFALEGSYSLHPEKPMERLYEFKKMVGVLHKNNIRVIMDVVYNHIFDYQNSCFEKLLPGFYFRKNSEGKVTNGSGCGNEFASEKPMVAKAIYDSVCYFVDVFDIDGFRFDLMGLLDINLMNRITAYVKNKKPNALIYGEGWNMGEVLPFEKKACSDNYKKMPQIGFFNEQFRDTMSGNVFEQEASGFLMGYNANQKVMKSLYLGTRFANLNNSINYVECHDNATIFDRLIAHFGDDHKQEVLKRIVLANAITVLFRGVPFVHMGQEIGQSKFGLDNTYNVPKVNNLSYSLLDERFEMARYFHDFIVLRKHFLQGAHYAIPPVINLVDIDNPSAIMFKISTENPKSEFKEFYVVINPSKRTIFYEFDSEYLLVLSACGLLKREERIMAKLISIPPISVLGFGKKA